jgi:hypothetical protein
VPHTHTHARAHGHERKKKNIACGSDARGPPRSE